MGILAPLLAIRLLRAVAAGGNCNLDAAKCGICSCIPAGSAAVFANLATQTWPPYEPLISCDNFTQSHKGTKEKGRIAVESFCVFSRSVDEKR
jgi:hypothetical protein